MATDSMTGWETPMPERILVTGGTGVLGRVLVQRLLDAGHRTRVMSRQPRPTGTAPHEWAVADLRSGEGVDAAIAGVDVIVHCATAFGPGRDVKAARKMIAAAQRAGSPHLVYISIVGADRLPLRYYRDKLAAERLIGLASLPYTILRSTQFHDLVRVLLAGAAKAPVLLVPAFGCQPIDVRDVAGRLAELALGDPVGRAPDIGGPQVRGARELAHGYLVATGRRRPVLSVRLPGRTFRALRQGRNLAAEHPFGKITFEQYLAEHPDPRGLSYRRRS
jgi:uncharacterized protein YbjT (DUF2867 family)